MKKHLRLREKLALLRRDKPPTHPTASWFELSKTATNKVSPDEFQPDPDDALE